MAPWSKPFVVLLAVTGSVVVGFLLVMAIRGELVRPPSVTQLTKLIVIVDKDGRPARKDAYNIDDVYRNFVTLDGVDVEMAFAGANGSAKLDSIHAKLFASKDDSSPDADDGHGGDQGIDESDKDSPPADDVDITELKSQQQVLDRLLGSLSSEGTDQDPNADPDSTRVRVFSLMALSQGAIDAVARRLRPVSFDDPSPVAMLAIEVWSPNVNVIYMRPEQNLFLPMTTFVNLTEARLALCPQTAGDESDSVCRPAIL